MLKHHASIHREALGINGRSATIGPLSFARRLSLVLLTAGRQHHHRSLIRMAATPSTTGSAVKGAVVFLHGSGGTGPDLDWMLGRAGFKGKMQQLGYELICPTAIPRPYSLVGGYEESVWYDRLELSPDACEDPIGVDESYQHIVSIVNKFRQEKGVPSKNIFIGGFSMGGGMAMQFMSRYPEPLGGVFGAGSFLATESTVYSSSPAIIDSFPPVLLCHGQSDSMVRNHWGLSTAKQLYELMGDDSKPPRVAFYSFPRLDHELDMRELAVLTAWITSKGAIFPAIESLDERIANSRGGIMRVPLSASGKDILPSAPVAPAGPAPVIKMVVEELDGQEEEGVEEGSARVTFRGIPEDKVEWFLTKPITTRGAHFSFTKGKGKGTITTVFVSPKPQETAVALKEKVLSRLMNPIPEGVGQLCHPS